MSKYLVSACYTAEGLKGLTKDKAAKRKQAIESALATVVFANSDLTDKLGVADLASISVRADILSALEVDLRCIPESGPASA